MSMIKEFTYEEVEKMYEWCVRNNKGNFPVSEMVKKTLWSVLKTSLRAHASGYVSNSSKKKLLMGLWEEEWQQIKHCCLENSIGDSASSLDFIEKL